MDKSLILVVEDEPISCEILVDTLRENGYESVVAETGAAAWDRITEYGERLDAILLDRLLPDMDSLSLLLRLKAEAAHLHVPVIMQTSLSSEEDIAAGLSAGAYYYLTKPFPPHTLLAIVRSAVKDRHEYLQLRESLSQTRSILKHIDHASFWFCTMNEARDLAVLAANVAPNPERVVLGLTELMLNAIEHGNLAISYAEKTELIANEGLEAEVARRLNLPEYAGRRARLKIEHCGDTLNFLIEDEGRGFDWLPFIDMSPTRAFDTHGRGIAMSRLISFDHVEYRGRGNEVLGTIKLS